MIEITFLIEEAPEGGYTAKAIGESIFTESENLTDLKSSILDAVHCHFESDKLPKLIRLHFVREELLAV
ncbi:MAG: hypothetical protein K2Y22_15455 [Candidatus Obscuribacterales bacterium]|nr:hypothetical protein [Candidatus Obscuribacterales bacterium]